MRNLTISDEKEYVYMHSGMTIEESDIEILEGIFSRLLDKIAKLEKNAATPEGARLNMLEYSHDTLWKAQTEANKIVKVLRNDVLTLSRRLDLNTPSHMRMYKAIDKNNDVIERIAAILAQEIRATKKCEKRILDIEEFVGDL